jgi:hypothetical protein
MAKQREEDRARRSANLSVGYVNSRGSMSNVWDEIFQLWFQEYSRSRASDISRQETPPKSPQKTDFGQTC